jgi:hypothetical protein
MMALAITINLLPVFLTTIAFDLGKGTVLSAEQLGRVGAVTFIGLVGGILVTGPLADRWGGRIFAVGGNGLIAMGLATLHWTIDYPMLLGAAFISGVGGGILDMILSPIVSSLTRGQSQTPALNVLHSEDVIPLFEVEVKVKAPAPIREVKVVPEEAALAFCAEESYTVFEVKRIDGHAMVSLTFG